MQGWDVSGNDCYIIGPPGDLCAALLGRNWSSGATLGSGRQGPRWAGVFSSFASSQSEVMLTKQHFEFSLPAGRWSSWRRRQSDSTGKLCRVDGTGSCVEMKRQHNSWMCFSHAALNGKVITPNPVYNFYWLSLVFLHTGKGTGMSTAACE